MVAHIESPVEREVTFEFPLKSLRSDYDYSSTSPLQVLGMPLASADHLPLKSGRPFNSNCSPIAQTSDSKLENYQSNCQDIFGASSYDGPSCNSSTEGLVPSLSNKDVDNGTLMAESDSVSRLTSSAESGASNYPRTLCEISPVEDVESPFFFTNVQFPTDQTELMLPTTIEGGIEHQKSLMASDYNSFWRYKKHPKGPRPRLNFEIDASQPEKNPHKPITFSDPVFDKSQKNVVRHFGKARIGDGNDVTSNPEKLAQLGYEIAALNEKIATLGDTVKARREKVRLSSRLCRLKRMANHEANKIKLDGLEKEREELSSVITKLNLRFDHSDNTEESLIEELESLKKRRLRTKVAGQSGEYVNSLLQTYSESYRTRSESDD